MRRDVADEYSFALKLRKFFFIFSPFSLTILVAISPLWGQSSPNAPSTHTTQSLSSGYYTLEQAHRGQYLYLQFCSSCHGANLEGLSGPPLAGEAFRRDVEFNKITAAQLFGFISTQMPYDKPGRLSREQYELIFSYILYRNNFPAGSVPFSASRADKLSLLPFPRDGTTSSSK